MKMAKKRDYKTDIKIKLLSLGYTIISSDEDYVNMTTNLKFKCSNCCEIFERTPKSALKTNIYCQNCTQKIIVGEKLHKFKSVTEKISEFMNNNGYTEFTFKENSSEVSFKCKECDEMLSRKSDVLFKCSYPFHCKKCSNKINKPQLNSTIINDRLVKMNTKTICIEIGQFHTRDKIHFKCECGRVFTRKPNTVLSSKLFLCNHCSHRISNGEKTIMNILEKYDVDFVYQKTFDTCKNKLTLPFDFYLPHKNIIIEYDGELHFKDVYGNLEKQIENDNIKTKYCNDNNITLIRIPYWCDIEKEVLKII